MTIKELKKPLRAFLKQYPDQKLAELLAHAQDGKLAYYSCCCFTGAINAPHALQTDDYYGCGKEVEHLFEARKIPGAKLAETAYASLRMVSTCESPDEVRRRLIIPLIKSEMKQREWARAKQQEPVLVSVRRNSHVSEPFRWLINEFTGGDAA